MTPIPSVEAITGKRIIAIPSKNTQVEVDEMPWPAAQAFLVSLGDSLQIGTFVGVDKNTGRPWYNFDKLPDLIKGSETLSNFLIEKSTGKDAEFFATVRASEALSVLEAALEMNLSEDMVGKFKGIGRVIGRAFGVGPANPTPTPHAA